MKVYFYDKDTFEFKREAEANIDPLETELKGEPVYMLPANATFTAPPETGDYEVAVFEKIISAGLLSLRIKVIISLILRLGLFFL